MPDVHLTAALRSLFESGRDAMFITDRKGRFQHVNQAFLKLYGYEEDEVIGRSMGILKSNSHPAEFYQQMQQQLDAGKHWVGDINNISKSGEIIQIWAQITATEEGFVGTQIDLRERDRRARQLDQVSRLQSVATLAGGMAHEFNNILAALLGHLNLLGMTITLPKEKERIERMNNLIQRAAALIRQLLSFSRQQPTMKRQIHLGKLLKDTLPLIRPAVPKGITITSSIQSPGLSVIADPIHLQQAVFELATNARDAINANERSGQGEITIELKVVDGLAAIRVHDNGTGMDEKTMKRCSEPFFTTRAVGQGTGLGLSSTHSYIEQIGGTMNIDSTIGEGTTISLLIPVAEPTPQPMGPPMTLLLADDDPDVRESLADILRSNGHQVHVASGGRQVMELWHIYRSELSGIILDFVMPEMDGLEIASIIRQADDHTPIFIITGYSDAEFPPALNVKLLNKPLDPDHLLHCLAATHKKA
ncbi:MAG: PAS domain S-box protein [Mariprofundaceae bacterium]